MSWIVSGNNNVHMGDIFGGEEVGDSVWFKHPFGREL